MKIKFILLAFLIVVLSFTASESRNVIVAFSGSGMTGGDVTAPQLSSVAIGTDGDTWTYTYDEIVTATDDGDMCDGYTVTMSSAGALTFTYAGGTRGSDSVFTCTGSATVDSGETISTGIDYTQGTVQDNATNAMAALDDWTTDFTNNSTSGVCSTPTTGSVFNEGYVGAGSEVMTTDANVDDDFTLSGTPPTGSCTEGAQFTVPASTAEYSVMDIATSSFGVTKDIYASIYIDSITLADSASFAVLNMALTADGDTTNGPGRVLIANSAGTYYFIAYGDAGSTAVAITLDTWYEVKLHLDATAASSYLQVTGGGSTTCDGVAECTFTRKNITGEYVYVGATLVSSEALTMEVGYVYMDVP